MMSKKQLSVLIASLFAVTPALAQSDDFRAQGSVTMGGIYVNTDSADKDLSKLNEYQDLSNGMLSNIEFKGRNSKSWFEFSGENFGRDDLYVNARGGMYDVFKARAYTNWIPHNVLFDGITPYAGTGSSSLLATFPQPNPGVWNHIDIGYQRKDTGGYVEFQRMSPWYFRVDGNQVTTQGTKLGAASNGLSPGNGFVDLAFPVNYETNNVGFEGGYASKTMTFSVNYLVSNFGNKNETLSWTNPYGNNLPDQSWLAPDNDYQKLMLNGTIRALPWNSTLAARYTWDETKSSTPINPIVLNPTGSAASSYLNLQPDTGTFDGKEKRQTFTLGWFATPVASLETRAYYNWQKMDNSSTQVTFCPSGATTCDGTFENELWDYTKNNFGIDAYWRMNRANRFGGGYDWYNIKQDRIDFDNNTTNTFWLEWKNTSLETVQAKLKYWYSKRTGDYLMADAGVNANDPAYLNRFIRAFDLADLTTNRVKLTLDWAPRDNIGVAFEGIYKDNNYDETTLGRTGDTRYELFANVTYGTPSSWRMTLFGDYEHVNYDSYHRYISTPACATGTTNCNDPSTPPVATAYNWDSTVKNDNWLIGVGLDYPVNEKLALNASFLYENVDGSADMSAQNNLASPAIIPFNNYPNSTTTSFQLKGTYKLDKNWSFTGGYAYQKYDFKDNQFQGYTNIVPWPGTTTNAAQSYLNGWNSDPNYTANIFYLTAKFSWDAAPLPPAPVKVAEAPRPVVAPPPPPPPAPAPAPAPAPQVQRITLDSKVLFDFDKAVLKPEGKAAIDSMVVAKLNQMQKLEVVVVTGHTDRLGSDEYNQKLSQRRADAVRDYLVSKGVDKAKVETIAMGEKQPVVQCDQKNRKELIACLQPNRRVEVQAKGEAKK